MPPFFDMTVQRDTARALRSHIFYLQESRSEVLEERRLKYLLKKHSEFIGIPIDPYVESASRGRSQTPSRRKRRRKRRVQRATSQTLRS